MAFVCIGLGTNLGDRSVNIKKAKDELIRYPVEIVKESSVDETEPVDFLDQPKFLNQVIGIKTDIPPHDLLKTLKEIEEKLGREKTVPKGPRIIDLDILLYDDIILDTKDLKIPHPEIKNRKFILKHLIEINPDITDPQTGIQYMDIYNRYE